ncbi:hypothetical protein [Prochlorococcus marinus]|uniref:hypothetical protein n=1 Tax=Prochlorococcus marinus TaxID=1219 RepID=UPI001AD956FF|nr:hypothetical protein [Prochlorococcus marinus]MBO8221072.1 hypothetical protein [Prochlorococcus marinus CUG1417]MBW3075684.1 hypothetical protein [Prochlorococcus marinus str. MU1417]
MKFELKTENKNYLEKFSLALRTISALVLIIILCDASFKLRIISRHYLIDYNCKLLSVEKTKSNFKKLARLSNLKSKQRIWEFCKEFVK